MKNRTLDRHPWPDEYLAEYEELIKPVPSMRKLVTALPIEGALANAAYVLKSLIVSELAPDYIVPMEQGGVEIAWTRPAWGAKIECSNEGTIIFTYGAKEKTPQVIDYTDFKLGIGSWAMVSGRMSPHATLPAVA